MATSGKTAICYLLADPAPESRIESAARRLRSAARSVPFLDRIVRPAWSPERRMGYRAGLRASVQSLRRQHLNLPPVVLLQPTGQLPPLADIDEIVTFDPASYASIPPWGSYFGREIYYKLEVFNLRGYDRIIYLDSDTVIIDDISPLWDMDQFAKHSLYAVRETPEMGVHPYRVGKFNLGVMLVNRPFLGGTLHRELHEIARCGESPDGTDQGVLECYLGRKPDQKIGELDASYNVMVVAKKSGDWARYAHRIRILHYVNQLKPWASDHYRDAHFDWQFKRLWDDAYRPDVLASRPPAPAPVDREFFKRLIEKTENFGHVTWLGHPIWQNILDLWTIQETICEVRPSLLIECGTCRGGSSYFFGTLFDLLGHGHVITIDIEKQHNLAHPRVSCLIGDSLSAGVLDRVSSAVSEATGPVMVVLDSEHTEAHVRREMEAYHRFVTPGSFMMVQDGVTDTLPFFASGRPGPLPAIESFLAAHREFEVDAERCERFLITHSPKGWLRRLPAAQ